MKSLADWTTARAIEAPGPSADDSHLREAYLGLLKLALCDLAGATTISVGRLEDDQVFSRELPEDQLALRTNGMDWPLSGLTMGGLLRLDDLQVCVESVVADGVEGDIIEAGAWRGGSSILIRATLDTLGDTRRKLWVADSFQGFPRPDAEQFPADRANDLDMFEFLSASLDEVRGHFERFGCTDGVEFVPGFFADTLPALHDRGWAIVRLDGDTYEATWQSLEALYPSLVRGGYLIIDDYGAFEECRAAVDDFRREHGIEEPMEKVDWTCMRWRREHETAVEIRSRPDAPASPTPKSPEARLGTRRKRPIMSMRELELSRELEALREQLGAVQAELGRIRGSLPVRLARAARRAGRRIGGEER